MNNALDTMNKIQLITFPVRSKNWKDHLKVSLRNNQKLVIVMYFIKFATKLKKNVQTTLKRK